MSTHRACAFSPIRLLFHSLSLCASRALSLPDYHICFQLNSLNFDILFYVIMNFYPQVNHSFFFRFSSKFYTHMLLYTMSVTIPPEIFKNKRMTITSADASTISNYEYRSMSYVALIGQCSNSDASVCTSVILLD